MLQSFRKFILFVTFLLPGFSKSLAQIVGPVPSPYPSIEQNSVSNMAALGDTLWIAPGLNRTINNDPDWFFPEGADRIINGGGRIFSLALAPDTVWAGLGYNADTPDGSLQAGLGFHFSTQQIDCGLEPAMDWPQLLIMGKAGRSHGSIFPLDGSNRYQEDAPQVETYELHTI